MPSCKFCSVEINWLDKKPTNIDGSGHQCKNKAGFALGSGGSKVGQYKDVTTVMGVTLQGLDMGKRDYVPVAGKILECNQVKDFKPGYTVINTCIVECNNMFFYKVWIEVNGCQFPGTAQIRFDSNKGADATDPMENAETSSIGRALSLAGFGNLDNNSICSSEDMIRVLNIPDVKPVSLEDPVIGEIRKTADWLISSGIKPEKLSEIYTHYIGVDNLKILSNIDPHKLEDLMVYLNKSKAHVKGEQKGVKS